MSVNRLHCERGLDSLEQRGRRREKDKDGKKAKRIKERKRRDFVTQHERQMGLVPVKSDELKMPGVLRDAQLRDISRLTTIANVEVEENAEEGEKMEVE